MLYKYRLDKYLASVFFVEIGFIMRDLGCPNNNEISRTSSSTRHECGRLCLADTNCVSFSYLYTEDPSYCILHSQSCKGATLSDIHTYDKGEFTMREEMKNERGTFNFEI